jgi:hypothetical protein
MLVEARLGQREIGIVDEGFTPDLKRQHHRIIVRAGIDVRCAPIATKFSVAPK